MNQNHLTLALTLEETNLTLTALGDRPYAQVFGLVQKIQQQAGGQTEQETFSLTMSLEEVNACLNALGDRPYVQVFGLVQKIQQQARAQIQQAQEVPAVENNQEEKVESPIPSPQDALHIEENGLT